MSLTAKKIFYGIALTIAAIAFFGCSQPVDPPADITWTAAADGASGATTSTKINITFAGSVTDLTAEQITLTNGTGTATKGVISGDGANWSLGITVETAGDLTIVIDKAGVESEAKTVTVHKQAAAAVAYTVVADGESDTTSSTKINFTFDTAVTGLTAEQITLTNGTGTVTKAALTGSGANWSLGIAVDTAGSITVVITKDSIAGGAKTVTVHKQGEATPDPVAYIAAADGESGKTSSTKIDFTFDAAVEDLTAEDIAVTPGTGSITTGALTGSGANWSLAITVETAGNVKLVINKPGIVHTEKDLTVYAPPALTDMVSPGLGSGGGWVTTESGISGEGAAQTMTLNIVEEPLAYFGIIKTAEQTITVSGADEAKVTRLADGVSYGDKTAGDTAALFTVNMEDLLFDGAFGETDSFNADAIPDGTETRSFILTVSETDKAPREIAVSLNITLDQTTETSIYHREGEPGAYHYTKVRDAALTEEDTTVYLDSSYTFSAFDEGSVKDLQNAFVWVDHHGLEGTSHEGYTNGTTEGYSEYRLFLKQSQQIGKIGFVIINEQGNNDTRDNMSIELYGAGPAGKKELRITRNPDFSINRAEQGLNFGMNADSGFISMGGNSFGVLVEKYKALVLGKNITIDAEGSSSDVNTQFRGSGSGGWRTLRVTYLIDIGANSMFIMNNGSKLTGCCAYSATTAYGPICIGGSFNGKAYLKGGAITGNIVGNCIINAVLNNVILTGTGITNNIIYGTQTNQTVIFNPSRN